MAQLPKFISPGIAAALAAATTVSPASGQTRPIGDVAFDSAYYAWEAGDYSRALTRLGALLTGSAAERYREPAALLTGELFVTTELTTDGRMARWSPDGAYASFVRGTGGSATTTILAMSGAPREVMKVPGAATAFGGRDQLAYIDATDAAARALVIRNLRDGSERRVPGLSPTAVLFSPDGPLHYLAGDGGASQLYRLDGSRGVAVTAGAGSKTDPYWLADGRVLYTLDRQSVAVAQPGQQPQAVQGTALAVSADRTAYAFVSRDGTAWRLNVVADGQARSMTVPHQIASPRLSPDGSIVAYQAMPREDWEIYTIETAALGAGAAPRRLTHEIQHDLMPQFLDGTRLLAVMGEARHRRSYMYDVSTGRRARLFHNNTVRTVAPEYEWAASPDGRRVLIVAERDGDTVSPERGVYVMDLSRQVGIAELVERVHSMHASETALEQLGRTLYAPIAGEVAAVVANVSKDRIHAAARDLFAFDSKHITQPGNAKAIEYLAAQLRSYGYEPELQYFEATGRGAGAAVRTANVIARLPGTMDPDAVYVVSSHFDSVVNGPGADDDTSGATALLESARVMAGKPQRRTIEFAFFTGEEAGLLGSREYVRRAVAEKKKIVGALNNDMIGFANDQRLDNTIRYSNDGIRDVQHAAAMGFTDLITYDAKYYKSTDAQAYYDAYGDIVGGIGSYPILGNPHYHQSHDVLETINQQLVAEVAKTNVATLMLLASSPSRVSAVKAVRSASGVNLEWARVPESDVTAFIIEWGAAGQAAGAASRGSARVEGRDATSAVLRDVRAGDEIRIKAVGSAGMRSWDWARVTAP